MKKLLAALLAVLMLGGVMAVGASAASPAGFYQVSYDGNAAGVTGVPADSAVTAVGTPLTLDAAVPVRGGYTFQGWSKTAAGTVDFDPGDAYTEDVDVTLYAVWQAIPTYTVTYDANGGAGAPAAQTELVGTALTLSAAEPTKTGFIFKGWSKTAAGAVDFAAGASYSDGVDATLYAVWEAAPVPLPATYTIAYDDNGGSGGPSAQTKTEGVALTLSATVPTRAGYTFKGWAVSASGAVVYAAGGVYTADAAATLFAVWEPIQITPPQPVFRWWYIAPLYLVWFVVRTVIWILFGWLWMPFPAFGKW